MYLLSCSIGLLFISAFILGQNASDRKLVKSLKGEEAKTLKGEGAFISGDHLFLGAKTQWPWHPVAQRITP